MNENVNLVEILMDCPKDTVFYSSIYGNVSVEITTDPAAVYPIYIYKTKHGQKVYIANLTKEGKFSAQYGEEPTLFPSKDQRDWSKFSAPWHKKKRFDPNTLKPFDRVLVRDRCHSPWGCNLFSHIVEHDQYPYKCVGNYCVYCIPYNDDTKHLVGKADNAPEFYRYWEED